MLTFDSPGRLVLSIKTPKNEQSEAAQIYPFLHVLSTAKSKKRDGKLEQRVQMSPSSLAQVKEGARIGFVLTRPHHQNL